MEYTRKYLDTGRLRVAYHAAGTPGTKKLLLLHGNLSSSVFFLPLFPHAATKTQHSQKKKKESS